MDKLGRLVFVFLFLVPFILIASEIQSDPLLRIETGMHISGVKRVGIDKNERYVVTCSIDKTIRVWDFKNGNLLKTLRPPIGEENEGKIYAVAISPDGRYVAGGGDTGFLWDRDNSVYIFDLNTGNLIKRIKGIPNVINQISYSKDGRYLAVGVWGNIGIKVYDTNSYKLVFEDKNYGDSIYGIDFSNSGLMVVSSFDGYLRLYSKDFKLIKKRKIIGGERPFQVSFSPDGTKIVVGFDDTKNVYVISSKDLKDLYRLDTRDIEGCNFFSVAFSGDYIYAAGNCQKLVDNEWKIFIRKWDKDGNIQLDMPVTDNSITHLVPLKDGGIAFGSFEPSFGLIDADGNVLVYKQSEIIDFRNMFDKFRVSYDGSQVEFIYELGGESYLFDAISGNLGIELNKENRLTSPVVESDIIKITNWKDTQAPMINGKNISIDTHDFSSNRNFARSKGICNWY